MIDDIELEHTLDECSYWRDWMQHELALGGVEPPSEETCLLFASRAVALTNELAKESVNTLAKDEVSRNQLIQALIVHASWRRAIDLRRRCQRRSAGTTPLSTVEAQELAGRKRGRWLIETSDERQYLTSFPDLDRDTVFATQVICFELAGLIGLPVPSVKLIIVPNHLALKAGARINNSRTQIRELRCLGILQETQELTVNETGKFKLPLSLKTRKYLAGKALVDVLALNSMPESPRFHAVNGHAEPLFDDFSYCLMGGVWNDFLKAHSQHAVPPLLAGVKMCYDQAETWIKRIEHVDLDQVCEVAMKLPPEWYGRRPRLVASVVSKIDERRRGLREIVLRLLKMGKLRYVLPLITETSR